MPSHRLVPRIRIDLPDSSSCSISPSSTLDIRDALGPAKLLPKLLAEDFAFDGADDVLYFEDGHLRNFPCFPMGRQPPLFILNSHRARLPFPIRPDAFELGDFCRDEEDVYPLLTAPTTPRMKMMVKEQLYVQKWVDTLTLENPPKHIPWTCEMPTSTTKKKWIAEGSIFPADMVKPDKCCIADTDRSSALADQAPYSRELCACSEGSLPISASTESYTLPQHAHTTKSANDNPGGFHGDSKATHRMSGASRTPSRPILLPSASPVGTTSSTSDAPLAIRRGKSLSRLKLNESVIEHLEYPDIPTAFRGSPAVWSPRLDTFPAQSFTDHDSMLLDLKSKCAALGSGVSTYIQEPLHLQPQLTRASLSVDEWAFTRGLAIDSSFLGSTDSRVPRKIVTDTSVFLPDDSLTPVKDVTAHLRFPSTPAAHLPGNRSSGPPGVPLPPRPALINPSTPSHVRGILKKVKNVRFEDVTTKEIENCTLPAPPPPGCRSPLLCAVSSDRPWTPMPEIAKSSTGTGPPPPKEALGKSIQKKSATRSRPPPKRAKANEKPGPVQVKVGNTPEPSKPTLVTVPVERPCRSTHVKENTNPTTTASRAQARQKANEIDIRRGIEGTTKSRLSTPLRNIFRFR